MNTNKIKIELNRSELQALIEMLDSCRPRSNDLNKYLMAASITRKVYSRLLSRLQKDIPVGKSTKLSLNIVEGIALITMLHHADPGLTWNEYNQVLFLKIHKIVNQKLA